MMRSVELLSTSLTSIRNCSRVAPSFSVLKERNSQTSILFEKVAPKRMSKTGRLPISSVQMFRSLFHGIRLHGLEPRVDELHDRLIRAHPELQYYVTSSKRLHFTCFTLSLSSEEDVERAVQCLQECKPIVNEIFETDRFKSVSFSQLDDFPENVLYLKASESESMSRLERMTSCLKIKFNEIGLLGALREDERWTPHMTIAKKSKNLKRTLQDKRIFDASEYEGLARSFFADAALVSKLSFVELLSMRGEGTPESDPLGVAGYYKTVCAVNIHCS